MKGQRWPSEKTELKDAATGAIVWQMTHAPANQHNGVTVSRPGVNDGEESPLDRTPTFSALLSRREDEGSAATSTLSRDLNGMDWTRHILWAKERYFVVFDEITAREAGPVTLRCRWRTLGDSRLNGHRLHVAQKPRPNVEVKDRRELSLVLVHCDDAAVSMTKGIEPRKAWEAYPYAEPEVQVLLEQIDGNLKAGEGRAFINVFAVLPTGQEDRLTAKRVSDRVVEVTCNGCRERVDLNEGTISDVHRPPAQ